MDYAILDFIQNNLKSAFLDPVMVFISSLGNYGILWIVLTLLLLCFRKTRHTGVLMAISLAITFVAGEVLIKNVVDRLRPFIENPEVALLIPEPASFSFPSGHTASSFAAAWILFLRSKKMGVPALILALLIAFSRLYLYVHYPSDVLAGLILGILVAQIVWVVYKRRMFNRYDNHVIRTRY